MTCDWRLSKRAIIRELPQFLSAPDGVDFSRRFLDQQICRNSPYAADFALTNKYRAIQESHYNFDESFCRTEASDSREPSFKRERYLIRTPYFL